MSEQTSTFLLEPDAIKLLRGYNIPFPKHALAASPEEARTFAGDIGFPVVMKIVSPDVLHKSDAGGVLVNLIDPDQVEHGYHTLIENVNRHVPGARIKGVLVVEQAQQGVETIIGALDDPTFGATVMFGLGGIFAEVLRDVTFRIAPFEKRDAEQMIREIKGFPLLSGARGAALCDLEAISELLLAVSRLVSEHPEIRELDLNPVRVYEKGLLVLDARVLMTAQ